MAYIYVNVQQLQALLPVLEQISEYLESKKSDLESVKNDLSLGKGTHDIKKRIDGYIDKLEEASDNVYNMKEALEDIIRLYMLTEAILSKDTGQIIAVLKDKGIDFIQDGLDGIGEFLEDWLTKISRSNDNVLNRIDDDDTRNGFTDDYKKVLYQLYDDVPPEYLAARNLYDKHVEDLIVADFYSVDSKGKPDPYHSDGKLYINTTADLSNARGNGTTYYHEFGHFIVHQEGWIKDGSTQGDFAKFEESLKKEVSAYISNIEAEKRAEGIRNGYTGAQLDKYVERETQAAIEIDINGSSNEYYHVNNGLSDIIDGVSNNKYQASYGHGTTYWDANPTRVANEAFAQFFSAQMTGDTIEIEKMKEIMPETYKIYMQMIENAG